VIIVDIVTSLVYCADVQCSKAEILRRMYQYVCSVAGWVEDQSFCFFSPVLLAIRTSGESIDYKKSKAVYIVIKIWGYECVTYGE
jgi:hypothetical protein